MEGLTKEELNQLNDLKQEIKEIEGKIEQLNNKKIEATYDKVKSSYSEFPYIQGNKTIYGFDEKSYEARENAIESKIKLLAARKKKAEIEEERISQFINSVEDSKIRRILEYRYIDGYKWNKIAKILNCDRTTPEKIVTKYLNEHEN